MPNSLQPTHDFVPADAQHNLASTVIGETLPNSKASNLPPAGAPAIPGYRITHELARGGMGQVWAAVDLELEREVAIKTLLPGADPERFITEAKITAKLPHPGIPPVHRLGTLPDGTSYLAMKLIRGQTLAAQFSARSTSKGETTKDLPRLIQIFEQIAQAVGFAHAQGIIHRDLKPLNVMVGAFGEVQVMDWGLAKTLVCRDATRSAPTHNSTPTDLTRAGTIMGTPGFMAPEQARGEPVDARADVFALGSILCMILTDQPAIMGGSVGDIVKKTAAGDLADAFTRLDTCGADAELVTLAKQCLATKAEDRPAHAQQVAEHVAAYRAGVEARLKQAETERAEALVREAEGRKRRRLLLWSATTVAAVLVVGIAGTSVGMWHANSMAIKERDARTLTEKQLTQIDKGIVLFAGMLTGINPHAEELGGPPLYAQLRANAEKAAAELAGEAVGDDLAVARLQTILGNTLRELGSHATAVSLLQQARSTREARLGSEHADTLVTLNNLGLAFQDEGRRADAIDIFRRVHETYAHTLGADHPSTLATLSNLAAVYQVAGQALEAIPLLEKVHEAQTTKLGADDLESLNTLNSLAAARLEAGQLAEAARLLEQSRHMLIKKLGQDHATTLATVDNLAQARQALGENSQALQLYELVREARARKLGVDHPATLTSSSNLASAYLAANQPAKAISLFEQIRGLQSAKLGPDHPHTLTTLNNLAYSYLEVDRLAEAIDLFRRLQRTQVATLGADHPHTLSTLNNLAMACQRAGQMPEAIAMFQQVYDAEVRTRGADHPNTLTTLNNLASSRQRAGQVTESLPLFERAAQGIARRGFKHEYADSILPNTVNAYVKSQQYEHAERWQRQWLDHLKRRTGPADGRIPGELSRLGTLLLKRRQWTNAETALRESLALQEQHQPHDWVYYSTQSLLGAAQIGQGKYAEAEPLLLQGYLQMKEREAKIPPRSKPRLAEALDRLVQLYTETNRPAEAAKWRAEKESLFPPPWPWSP